MKLVAVTPTRGDRNYFLNKCKQYMSYQTVKPDNHFIIDYKPTCEGADLRNRVLIGLEKAVDCNADYVAIVEDDDWYSPDYFRTMLNGVNGEDAIGLDKTIYYHLRWKSCNIFTHSDRSSLFSSIFSGDFCKRILNLKLPSTFIDLPIWQAAETMLLHKLDTDSPIAIGVKHGVGKCGGSGHTTQVINGAEYLANREFWFNKVTGLNYLIGKNQ